MDIDKETGLLAGPDCPKTISEAFIAGTEPTELCHAHWAALGASASSSDSLDGPGAGPLDSLLRSGA